MKTSTLFICSIIGMMISRSYAVEVAGPGAARVAPEEGASFDGPCYLTYEVTTSTAGATNLQAFVVYTVAEEDFLLRNEGAEDQRIARLSAVPFSVSESGKAEGSVQAGLSVFLGVENGGNVPATVNVTTAECVNSTPEAALTLTVGSSVIFAVVVIIVELLIVYAALKHTPHEIKSRLYQKEALCLISVIAVIAGMISGISGATVVENDPDQTEVIGPRAIFYLIAVLGSVIGHPCIPTKHFKPSGIEALWIFTWEAVSSFGAYRLFTVGLSDLDDGIQNVENGCASTPCAIAEAYRRHAISLFIFTICIWLNTLIVLGILATSTTEKIDKKTGLPLAEQKA